MRVAQRVVVGIGSPGSVYGCGIVEECLLLGLIGVQRSHGPHGFVCPRGAGRRGRPGLTAREVLHGWRSLCCECLGRVGLHRSVLAHSPQRPQREEDGALAIGFALAAAGGTGRGSGRVAGGGWSAAWARAVGRWRCDGVD